MNNESWLGQEWQDYLELKKQRPEEFCQDEQLHIEFAENKVAEFQNRTGRKIGVVYRSKYRILVVDLICTDGQYYAYERLLPAALGGGVVAVPVCDGKLVLLKQYRHAMRKEQYAFPRGFAELGISPETNVCKEIHEELGAAVNSVHKLGSIVADSGLCGAEVLAFLCDVENVKLQYRYEGILDVLQLTPAELEQWITEGRINDGFTLAAYNLYKCKKET